MTEESLFDAIAALLPAEQREPYYRRMAHLRKLNPNDEILVVCEAMGVLALITRETPEKIAGQRAEIEQIFARSIQAIQATQQSTFDFYRQMEARIVQLPVEIQNGIDSEGIALRIGEGIRQSFNLTRLPETANGLQAVAGALRAAMQDFSKVVAGLGDRNSGVLPKVNAALQELDQRLGATMGRLDSQLRRLQWSMLSGVGILCAGCLVIGVILGVLLAHAAHISDGH